jgi:hypothetical protein
MKSHRESDLQIRCLKWFRYQYPEFARLMQHPHNEGNGLNRRQQAIANAEGVTKGVADILLHLPAENMSQQIGCMVFSLNYFSLAIEMKTPIGKQSADQKTWQRFFEAAGGKYIVIRDYDTFVEEVSDYMEHVPVELKERVIEAYRAIMAEEDKKVIEKLKKITRK